jgi:hypothetical protein
MVQRLCRAVVLLVSAALPLTAQPELDSPARFWVATGLSAARLTDVGLDEPDARSGLAFTGTAALRFNRATSLRLDGLFASRKVVDVIQMLGVFSSDEDDFDRNGQSRRDSSSYNNWGSANLAIAPALEYAFGGTGGLSVRAGPAWIYAAPSEGDVDRRRGQSRFPVSFDANGWGWRVGASVSLMQGAGPVRLTGDILRARSRSGPLTLVPIGISFTW